MSGTSVRRMSASTAASTGWSTTRAPSRISGSASSSALSQTRSSNPASSRRRATWRPMPAAPRSATDLSLPPHCSSTMPSPRLRVLPPGPPAPRREGGQRGRGPGPGVFTSTHVWALPQYGFVVIRSGLLLARAHTRGDDAGEVSDGHIILVGGALLAGALVASVFAARARLPVLLLFLAVGIVVGSGGTGWVSFGNYEAAQRIGTIALALILFEGGLSTGLEKIRPVLAPAFR